jgi:hypothetical protein
VIDRGILQQANTEAFKFGFRGNHFSHVLLAACAAHEDAAERHSRGIFTTALTRALAELKSQIAYTTYSTLMSSLKMPSRHGQHPQCDGQPANFFLFSGRDRFGLPVFRLSWDDQNDIIVAAGEAHGIGPGTEMMVYSDESALNALGVLIVDHVEPTSAKLRRKSGPRIEISNDSWATIHHWPDTAAFKIYADFSLRLPQNITDSKFPLVIMRRKADADVALHSNISGGNRVISFESLDPFLVEHAGPAVTPALCIADDALSPILSKISHFHFYLHRQKFPANKPLMASKDMVLHLYQLKDGEKFDSGKRKKSLFKDNLAHLELTDIRFSFGMEIRNKSRLDLYAYLFAFDPDDYSIQVSLFKIRFLQR